MSVTARVLANKLNCFSFNVKTRTTEASHEARFDSIKTSLFGPFANDLVCVSFNTKLRTHVANHTTRFDSIKTSFFSSVGSIELSLNRTRI